MLSGIKKLNSTTMWYYKQRYSQFTVVENFITMHVGRCFSVAQLFKVHHPKNKEFGCVEISAQPYMIT